MKHNFHILFLLVFLITTSHSFARKIASKEYREVYEKITSSKESSVEKIGSIDSFDKLMGVEDDESCQDEECLKRRVVVEAHLDYIYTQQHKP